MSNAGGLQGFLSTLDFKLEPPIQKHLKNVYATLSASLILAATGAYIHLFTDILKANGWIALASIVLLGFLTFTRDDGKNRVARLLYLLGFAFTTGLCLGPLLDLVIMINPTIVPTALLTTSLIFICFTLSSFLANQRRYLYLGGTLFSALSLTFMLGLLRLFFRVQLLWQVEIYLGLFIACGFILYDTQMILEKRRLGDTDFVSHAMELFTDFIQVFRYLLIILASKEEPKKKK